MAENLTYEEAQKELNEILASIESGDISLDEITDKVKRAGFLIDYCQKRLRSIEEDLDKLFETED